jgi:hypothetical protein
MFGHCEDLGAVALSGGEAGEAGGCQEGEPHRVGRGVVCLVVILSGATPTFNGAVAEIMGQ